MEILWGDLMYKDAVAFRKVVNGIAVSCVCLQENVVDVVHPLEADMVYLDMTECEIDKLIDALSRLKTEVL